MLMGLKYQVIASNFSQAIYHVEIYIDLIKDNYESLGWNHQNIENKSCYEIS
jgi:hypothetical protein